MKGWIAFIVIVGAGGAYLLWPRDEAGDATSGAAARSRDQVVHASTEGPDGSTAGGEATATPESVAGGHETSAEGGGSGDIGAGDGSGETPGLSSERPSAGSGRQATARRASVAELQEGIARDPASRASAAARLELARRQLAEGRSEEAASLLAAAIQSGADLHGLGEIYLQLALLTPQQNEERARGLYSKAIEMTGLSEAQRTDATQRLGRLNSRLVFSKRPYSHSFEYEIQPGDSLWAITRSLYKKRGLRVTTKMLQAVNEMGDSTVIQPGRKLKVIDEPMRILVEKRRFKLTLFLGECILAQYGVGLGRRDSTPEGTFTVANRLVDPPWINKGRIVPFGHKDNVLGTRWLGFEATDRAEGLGIHGTWDPESIGKEMSNGCVRMQNRDVERLFDLVPVGTPVEIRL